MSSLAMPARRGAPMTDPLLRALIAVPFIYYGTMLVASLLYPGYSHVTQYASELGASGARYPWVFNAGAIVGGFAGIAGGIGTYLGLRSLGRGRVLAGLLAASIILQATGFIFAGLFPIPDERHGAYGMGAAGMLGPLLATISLWRVPPLLHWVRYLLVANALAVVAGFAIMMGVGEMVTRDNVGLFQRAFSLTSFPWMALVGWALLRLRAAR